MSACAKVAYGEHLLDSLRQGSSAVDDNAVFVLLSNRLGRCYQITEAGESIFGGRVYCAGSNRLLRSPRITEQQDSFPSSKVVMTHVAQSTDGRSELAGGTGKN